MANKPVSFEQALKDYDRQGNQSSLLVSEKERQEVLNRFPLQEWSNMPLSRYALGQKSSQESFCWWLEFGTPHVGSIKGGSARKHIIYKQSNGEWWFDRDTFKTEQDAWAVVRSGFCRAFEKASRGDWDSIDDLQELGWGPALRTKTLYCYFPEELLPISSIFHITHFLTLLGEQHGGTIGYQVVRLNRLLQAAVRKRANFAGWSNKELEQFLYSWADPRDQKRIVKIAPGHDAEYWKECLKDGYICVNWDEMGDLCLYDSKESCQRRFNELYSTETKSMLKTKFKELWTLRELEPGDLVVANEGKSKILAVGEVVEPGYVWLEERPANRHCIKVRWDESLACQVSPQASWSLLDVAQVPHTLAAQILSSAKSGEKIGAKSVPVDPVFREIAEAIARKGQAILYGPPGTGKTFTARRFAVWWLLNGMGEDTSKILSDSKSFAQAEQRLSSARVIPRVWWVVANPSVWTWDQLFRDGRVEYRYGRLQRNYPLARKGDLVVGYQATPEKKVSALARISREMFTNEHGETKIELEPLTRVTQGLTYEELLKDEILSRSEPMQHNNQGTLFKLTEQEFDRLAVLLIEREPALRGYFESEDDVGALTRLTFHASYSYEDFIEGYRPDESRDGSLSLKLVDGVFKRVCRAAEANSRKQYLVLIDEINRANLAKVLGELITLLEKDKRGLSISLPQSKEPFTIPPNVFVVGTMNTADRSIKLLDAALRRRFAFIELMPDPELLAGVKFGTLTLSQFLEVLNRRVAEKEGREKQIGHSFLMDDVGPITDSDEFARRFRQEILPLLKEYCYDDYRVLSNYIGEELVDASGQVLNDDCLRDTDQLISALERAFAAEK
jgi:5-methylcytosine-specific restriction enzyme B